MNSYIKKNIILPIDLHDTTITGLEIKESNTIDGELQLVFEDGYFLVQEKEVIKTDKSIIKFSGIDYDYSYVYYYEDTKRNEVSFEKLRDDIRKKRLEIIDEAYGYNLTKISGVIFDKNETIEFEIVIYHFNETVYEWEGKLRNKRSIDIQK